MEKKECIGRLFAALVMLLCAPAGHSQTMNRSQMFNNIVGNVYQNPNHAITGQVLQDVLLNQNYSYNNLKTDTDFVSLFDTGYTYYKGMSVLSGGDSIYRCAAPSHHGKWESSDFRFVQVQGGGSLPPGGSEGQALVFHDEATQWSNYLYDVLGNTDVDWPERVLWDDAGVNALEWSSYNRGLYDDNGITSVDWNNRWQYDVNSSTSEDYSNRILYDRNGNTTANWQNCVLRARHGKSGTVPVLYWENQLLLDVAGNESMDWEQHFLYDDYTNLSEDYNTRYLYDNTGMILSEDWGDRWLFDFSGTTSEDYSARLLYNSFKQATVNWQSNVLFASTPLGTTPVLSWQYQWLIDDNETRSADWNQRYLYDNTAEISCDYNNRYLYDYSGDMSVDWGSLSNTGRTLIDDVGNAALSWRQGLYVGYDGSGTLSYDWGNRVLWDATAKTFLTYGDGTNPSAGTDIVNLAYLQANYQNVCQTQPVYFASAGQNFTCPATPGNLYIIASFASIASVGTITFPASPQDGQLVEYVSATASSAASSNFSPSPVVLSSSTPGAGTHLIFLYSASTGNWYQIQ